MGAKGDVAYSEFLSTPSARRATEVGTFELAIDKISIHALREEGDAALFRLSAHRPEFLSTPSARRATTGRHHHRSKGGFLSTPSARRATASSRRPSKLPPNFYPRPPRGGRLVQLFRPFVVAAISIHALREEGDVVVLRDQR